MHRVTPLLLAVDNSKPGAVRFLIRAGANPLEINNRQKGAAFPNIYPPHFPNDSAGCTNSSLFILACMHGNLDIAMTLHAAILAKGQVGREHMLHINNDSLDALGTAVFYGKVEVFKALFHAKCPSIFLDPDDRSPLLLPLRKMSQYNPSARIYRLQLRCRRAFHIPPLVCSLMALWQAPQPSAHRPSQREQGHGERRSAAALLHTSRCHRSCQCCRIPSPP